MLDVQECPKSRTDKTMQNEQTARTDRGDEGPVWIDTRLRRNPSPRKRQPVVWEGALQQDHHSYERERHETARVDAITLLVRTSFHFCLPFLFGKLVGWEVVVVRTAYRTWTRTAEHLSGRTSPAATDLWL